MQLASWDMDSTTQIAVEDSHLRLESLLIDCREESLLGVSAHFMRTLLELGIAGFTGCDETSCV
jgi:hypothetical protein